MHDLVIDDVVVVDGTGAARRHASVAVSAGRIAAIAEDPGPARQRVNGEGDRKSVV